MKKGDKALVVDTYHLNVTQEVTVTSAGKKYITADGVRYDAVSRAACAHKGGLNHYILTECELEGERAFRLIKSLLRTSFDTFASPPTSVLLPAARLLVEHNVVTASDRENLENAIALLSKPEVDA